MAQRRYTRQQINDALRSGEGTPDDTSRWYTTAFKDYIPDAIEPAAQWIEGADRKVLAGLVNAIPQIPQVPELAYHAAMAGMDKAVGGGDYMSLLGQRMYGREGSQRINDYVERELAAYTQGMTEEERSNPKIMEQLRARIEGSKGFNDARLGETSAVNQASTHVQDAVREGLALKPTYAMSSEDEIMDFLGGAIMPSPSKIGAVAKLASKAPRAVRYLGKVLEPLLPGSTGPVSAVANVAIPEALTQTLRTVQGAPNFKEGTAYLPQELAARDAQGAASAPVPFEEAAATQQQQPLTDLGFQYKPFAPAGTAPAATPATNPDRDEHGGGGATPWAILAGIAGTATVIGAALRGKLSPGAVGKVIQDVDSPAAAARMDPLPTDHIDLQPSLRAKPGSGFVEHAQKLGQRVKTGLQKTRAVEDVTRNELRRAGLSEPDVELAVTKITRETASASPLEVGHALKRTQLTGELPLLNRKTVPTAQIRLMRDTKMTPQQQELFQRAGVLADRLDSFNLTTQTMQDKINDKYIRMRGIRNPGTLATLTAEVRQLEAEVRARTGRNAQFDRNITMREVRQLLAQADADPSVKAALMGMRKVADDFREVGVASGMWTRAYADKFKRERPNFIPVSHDPNTGDIGKRIGKKLKGTSEPEPYSRQMFDSHRSPARTNRMADPHPVEKMHDIIDSLDTMVHEFHRQHRTNRATQTFFETLANTREWGKAAQVAHAPISIQDFEALSPGSHIGQILSEPNVVTYNANGKMYIMRTADSETARALRNNPSSTLAVADVIRRNLQSTYTGSAWAPLFAPVAAENELGVVRAKLGSEYSKGYLDQLFKNVFPTHSALSQTFDFIPDPTIRLQQAAAVFEMVSNSAINRVGEALGNHLMSQSTLFRQMGPQQSNAVAQAAIREMNDVRMRIMFFQEHNILDHQHLVHHNEGVFQDYKSARQLLNKRGPVSRTAGAIFNAYTDVVDAVRNSVKYAVASQNLDNLVRKYKGFDRIPNDVMRKYIHDMRYMSGDMTRAIGSETLSKGLSVIPYGQHIVNSTAHLMEGAGNLGGGSYTLGRILTNMVLPKVIMVGLLTQWMRSDDGKTNEFEDHWWSNMPKWQRMISVPVLSPQFLYDWATDAKKKPTMGDVIFMRQAPEAVPFAEVVSSMVQATGIYGIKADETQTWWDAWSGITSMANVNIPLLDTWAKLNADTDLPTNVGGDSDTSRKFQAAMGAMFGMAVDVVGAGYSATTDSLYRGSGIIDALEKGFTYSAETFKQKAPETLISPLFGNQRRHYTKSQVRDRNQDKFKAIEDISQTRSDMKQDVHGEFTMPATDDYDAQSIMKELHSTANARTMKALRTNRSKLYNQLERLDANRGNDTLPPADYTKRSEQLKMAIQDIDRAEEEVFQRMDARLAANYEHLGVRDIDTAIEYVKSKMHP